MNFLSTVRDILNYKYLYEDCSQVNEMFEMFKKSFYCQQQQAYSKTVRFLRKITILNQK